MRLGVRLLLGPADWPGAGEGAGGPGNVFLDIPTILDAPKSFGHTQVGQLAGLGLDAPKSFGHTQVGQLAGLGLDAPKSFGHTQVGQLAGLGVGHT
jgi:hypothetical protein